MATRIVEGKKPYTGGKAIEIDENKVISLRLREENNLIIRDEGDNEIYVDLQLPDGITPLDAFPVGITVGRVLIADDWDVNGTLVVFKTTSGDNIKLLYGDDGKLYIDNGTGLFKQIYLKGEVDALLQALRDYVDAQLALKQDKLIAGDYIEINENVISAVIPTMSRFLSIWNASSGEPISFPASTPFLYTTGDYYLIEGVGASDNYRPAPIEYDGSASNIPETDEVANGDVYIYDGAVWLLQFNHGKTVTFQNIAGDPYDNTNLATALGDKQNTLISGTNIKSINNQSLLGSGDLSIAEVPSGGTNGQVLTKTSQGPAWQNATGGAEIEYVTQVEYDALPSSKLTDGKHYVIYTADSPTPPSPGWQPGVNTLLYCPLNSTNTYTDQSGNNVQTTSNGVLFGTYVGVDCAYFDFDGSHKILIPAIAGAFPYMTMSVWSYMTTNDSYTQIFMIESQNSNMSLQPSSSGQLQSQTYDQGDHYITDGNGLNAWHHNLIVWDNGTSYFYVDGQLIGSDSTSSITNMYISGGALGGHYQNNSSIFAYGGYLSEAILEDKVRTAQEVSDYYDQTKGNYGIS